MSHTAMKTSLYLQDARRQQPAVLTTSSAQAEAQASSRHNLRNNVTFDDIAQIFMSNDEEDEEQVDFAMELERLLGSYERMN